jgi:hypothetical protein
VADRRVAVNPPAGGRKLTGDPVIVLARHPRLSAGQRDALTLTAVQKNPRLGRSRMIASMISSAVLSAWAASAALALSVGYSGYSSSFRLRRSPPKPAGWRRTGRGSLLRSRSGRLR